MTVVVHQRPATSLEDVGHQLREAFTAAQAAAAAESLVLVVSAPDLLGQGSLEDAAVAGGLLGMMRALVLEGRKKGWHVNVIAVEPGATVDDDLLEAAAAVAALNGVVLNAGSGHVGKVVP